MEEEKSMLEAPKERLESTVRRLDGGRRCVINKVEGVTNWWIGSGRLRSGQGVAVPEGPWEDWVSLSKAILEVEGKNAPFKGPFDSLFLELQYVMEKERLDNPLFISAHDRYASMKKHMDTLWDYVGPGYGLGCEGLRDSIVCLAGEALRLVAEVIDIENTEDNT